MKTLLIEAIKEEILALNEERDLLRYEACEATKKEEEEIVEEIKKLKERLKKLEE